MEHHELELKRFKDVVRRKVEVGNATPAGSKRKLVKTNSEANSAQVTATYSFAKLKGRRFATSAQAQTLSARALAKACSTSVDFDICNCMFVLIKWLINKLVLVEPDLWKEEMATLDAIVESRQKVCEEGLGLPEAEGKKVIQALVNGQTPTADLDGKQMVVKLQQLGMFLRWAACSCLPSEYQMVCGTDQDVGSTHMPWIPPKKWPEATIMSLWWMRVENMVLTQWVTYVLETVSLPTHLSLHFDGLRLDRTSVRYYWKKAPATIDASIESFIEGSVAHLQQSLGIPIQIVQKKHHSFNELLEFDQTEGTQTRLAIVECHPQVNILKRAGNCILLALHRLKEYVNNRAMEACGEFGEDLPANKQYRSYRDCFAASSVEGTPHLGFSPQHSGCYLIHSENGGFPHCLAVKVDMKAATCTVWQTSWQQDMELIALRRLASAAVDRKTMVTFQITGPFGATDSIYNCVEGLQPLEKLLDLSAGAGTKRKLSRKTCEYSVFSGTDTDSREVFYHALQEETQEYLCTLRTQGGHSGGKRLRVKTADPSTGSFRCMLCPFHVAKSKEELIQHVENMHTEDYVWTPSGTKFRNLVIARYDMELSQGRKLVNTLRNTAHDLRKSVGDVLGYAVGKVDRYLALVLGSAGPYYMFMREARISCTLRNVGYTWYERGFGELLFKEAIMSRGKVRTLEPIIQRALIERGCNALDLLPKENVHWQKLLKDLLRAPFIQKPKTDALQFAFEKL